MKYILSILLVTAIVPMSWANWSKDKGKNVKSEAIEFEKGSASLTEDHKSKIRDMVSKANKTDDMKLDVAVWSDQPFPKGDKALSEDQQKLAENRKEAIKEFVETLKFEGDVETYNMAESTSWLAKSFNTEASELKSIFAKEDKASADTMKEKYQAFKEKGNPMKAVFVMTRDQAKAETESKPSTDQDTGVQ